MENKNCQRPSSAENMYFEIDTPSAVSKKRGLTIKLLIPVLAVLCVLTIILVVQFSGNKDNENSYTTPLDLQMDWFNAKTLSQDRKAKAKLTNGFLDNELEELVDFENLSESTFEDSLKNSQNEYGKNFRFFYTIEDKFEMDADDLAEAQEKLERLASELKESIDEMEDFDSDDWEDFADENGMSKSDAKKQLSILKAIYKKLCFSDVTEGYTVGVTYYADGDALSQPRKLYGTGETICKINGRWVNIEILEEIL